MSDTVNFSEVGRLPLPGDNVAIATRDLPAGATVTRGDDQFKLSHTVLEGHRFACAPIPAGGDLLSWELPFGIALVDLRPGDYVINEKMLVELRIRNLDFELPAEPNFTDTGAEYVLDEAGFTPGEQVALLKHPGMFQGFDRGPARGSGTRNCIVILGTTSLTGSFARELAMRFKTREKDFPNIDGVVAVAHTEGDTEERPANFDIVLRTLAGFMTHSNVGAILAVDSGPGTIDNDVLKAFLEDNDYPLSDVSHAFFRHERSRATDLDRAEKIVSAWLPQVDAMERTERPIAHLKLAMQCGGSDAFSGISGNPLSSEVAKLILRHGGSANLAETTELIGAENYVLNNVRDLETARAFLGQIERYEELARWHGQSAEGNPSGGNLLRGLYNITVKSIGAAMKKHPDVRLDRVVEYGELMNEPGYYFMDSAGNDLESIAGQVACGCNVVHFITGNGSITNFPFVPTIKIVTTSGRYEMLSNEMDIDAGRYLEGESMERLAREAFDYTIEIASGLQSVGEAAGHSQVQLWRQWRQTNGSGAEKVLNAPKPDGRPLTIPESDTKESDIDVSAFRYPAWRMENGVALERIGLIAPTSLCAGQIAQGIADKLNAAPMPPGIDRFAALPHTEGCGTSRGYAEDLFVLTMIGYLRHRAVGRALLLEHGCEKTHNDEFRVNLEKLGVEQARFGWASIQNDGGIEAVTGRVMDWFRNENTSRPGMAIPERGCIEDQPQQPLSGAAVHEDADLTELRLGIIVREAPSNEPAQGIAKAIATIVNAGGSVVIAENDISGGASGFTSLFDVAQAASPAGSPGVPARSAEPCGETPQEPAAGTAALRRQVSDRSIAVQPTLAYGQAIERPGLHVMETPTRHLLEITTGLGGTGVDAIVVLGAGIDTPGNPMLPVIPCAWDNQAQLEDTLAIRLSPKPDSETVTREFFAGLTGALAAWSSAPDRNVATADFQMTRGWLGISL